MSIIVYIRHVRCGRKVTDTNVAVTHNPFEDAEHEETTENGLVQTVNF